MNDYSHVNDLSIRNRMIATEAMALKPNISAIAAKISGVAAVMGDWVNSKVKPQASVALVAYGHNLRDISKIQYTDISSTTISVPRGLRTNLPVYIASLVPMVEFCENLERDYLKPFSIWVALRKVSPLSLKESVTIRDLKGFKPADLDSFRQKITELLDPSARADRGPMSRTYPSLGSMEDCWKGANQLITRYMSTRPKSVIAVTEETAANIMAIVKKLEEQGEIEKVDAQTVAILSNICYNLAGAVEFYGVVGVILRELSVVCNNNNAELKKVINDAAKARLKQGMATESFVKAGVQGFEVNGAWFDYPTLEHIAYKECEEEMVSIHSLTWVFETVTRDSIDDLEITDKDSVIAIELDGELYPLMGLEYLKACEKDERVAVRCRIIPADLLK